MKKKFLVIGTISALSIMMLACFGSKKDDHGYTDDYGYDSEDYGYDSEDYGYDDPDDYGYDDPDDYGYDNSEEAGVDSTGDYEVGKVLGDDVVGYIYLPEGYHDFHEIGAPAELDMVQAQSDNMDSIITMSAFESNGNSAEDLAGVMYEQYANDSEATNLTGARVTIGGYDAYQIYCLYPNGASDSDVQGGMFYVLWIFETPDYDTKIHMIATEFSTSAGDVYTYPETFHFYE